MKTPLALAILAAGWLDAAAAPCDHACPVQQMDENACCVAPKRPAAAPKPAPVARPPAPAPAAKRHVYKRTQAFKIDVRLSDRLRRPVATPSKRPEPSDPAYKAAREKRDAGKYNEALEAFTAIAMTAKDPDLAKAAKRAVVESYSEVGTPDKAAAFFKRIDATNHHQMLEMLATQYAEQGKFDKAIYVYRVLISARPTDTHVCDWQEQVARSMLFVATNVEKIKAIVDLVKLYQAVRLKLPPAEAESCREAAAEMTNQLGRAYHSESVKTLNIETLAHAARLYRAYLDGFPDGDDAREIQYLLAELAWTRAEGEKNPAIRTGMWEEAATTFTTVATVGKLDATRLGEARHAAVLAWKNALEVDPDPTIGVGTIDYAKSTAPAQDLPERIEKLFAAQRAFAAGAPRDAAVPTDLLQEATIQRRYGRHDAASAILAGWIKTYRTHEHAELAARLLLDSYAKAGKPKEMHALVDQLVADTDFVKTKPQLSRDLARLRAVAP